ncbi:MAG: hypothetical protein ACYS76_16350 [Planctomycetota bacterium]|jgi:hypothetical protein
MQRREQAMQEQNNYFDTIVGLHAEGLDTSNVPVPEGITETQTGKAKTAAGQIGGQLSVIDATQRFLDNSFAAKSGKGFDPAAVPEYEQRLRDSLGANELNLTVNDNGNLILAMDQESYDNLPEGSQKIFSVIGAEASEDPNEPGGSIEVTPDMLTAHLGTEIDTLRTGFGKHGTRFAAEKDKTFNSSKSTSPVANKLAMQKRRDTDGARAVSTQSAAIRSIDTLSSTLEKMDHADSTSINTAGRQVKNAIIEAKDKYDDLVANATTEEEVGAAYKAYQREVAQLQANFKQIQAREEGAANMRTTLSTATEDGSFNINTYVTANDTKWSKKSTHREKAEANSAEAITQMGNEFVAEASPVFVPKRTAELMEQNPNMGKATAQAQAERELTAMAATLKIDATTAAVAGTPIASGSFTHLVDHAPKLLGDLKTYNTPGYMAPVPKASQYDAEF